MNPWLGGWLLGLATLPVTTALVWLVVTVRNRLTRESPA